MTNGVRPSNFLIPAIFSTLCCCLPLGVVAIVYASKVNALYDSGNVVGAMDAAGKAKMWTFLAVGLGFITQLIVGVIQVLAVLAQSQNM